jgi:hypothetical protein
MFKTKIVIVSVENDDDSKDRADKVNEVFDKYRPDIKRENIYYTSAIIQDKEQLRIGTTQGSTAYLQAGDRHVVCCLGPFEAVKPIFERLSSLWAFEKVSIIPFTKKEDNFFFVERERLFRPGQSNVFLAELQRAKLNKEDLLDDARAFTENVICWSDFVQKSTKIYDADPKNSPRLKRFIEFLNTLSPPVHQTSVAAVSSKLFIPATVNREATVQENPPLGVVSPSLGEKTDSLELISVKPFFYQ